MQNYFMPYYRPQCSLNNFMYLIKNNILFSRSVHFYVFQKSANLEICDHRHYLALEVELLIVSLESEVVSK